MVRVTFTANLERHLSVPAADVEGATVREVLDAVFAINEPLRSYVLDDQGALRKHVNVFVSGTQVRDRGDLSDAVRGDADVYVMQALSGG